MKFCISLLIAYLSLTTFAFAEGGDWGARLQEAKAIQKRAKDRHDAATAVYEAEQKACFKKFRVIDCQLESRKRYSAIAKEARMLENEGKAQERQVRKEKRENKDARQAEEAPKKAAELKEKEAEVSAEKAKADAARAKKLADKARKTQEGQARRAKDAERLRGKQEAHDRHVKEKLDKAARRAAEEEKK